MKQKDKQKLKLVSAHKDKEEVTREKMYLIKVRALTEDDSLINEEFYFEEPIGRGEFRDELKEMYPDTNFEFILVDLTEIRKDGKLVDIVFKTDEDEELFFNEFADDSGFAKLRQEMVALSPSVGDAFIEEVSDIFDDYIDHVDRDCRMSQDLCNLVMLTSCLSHFLDRFGKTSTLRMLRSTSLGSF